MAVEDYTTYTLVGTNIAVVGTNHIDQNTTRGQDAYLCKDAGIDHFGDFRHLLNMKTVGIIGGSLGVHVIWAAANNLGSRTQWQNACFVQANITNVLFQFYLCEYYNSTLYYNVSYIQLSVSTWYYLEMIKSGTSLTLNVYSDSARTNLLATRSLTLQTDHKLRYIYGCASHNDGFPILTADTDIEDLNLNEAEAAAQSVGSIMPLLIEMDII